MDSGVQRFFKRCTNDEEVVRWIQVCRDFSKGVPMNGEHGIRIGENTVLFCHRNTVSIFATDCYYLLTPSMIDKHYC